MPTNRRDVVADLRRADPARTIGRGGSPLDEQASRSLARILDQAPEFPLDRPDVTRKSGRARRRRFVVASVVVAALASAIVVAEGIGHLPLVGRLPLVGAGGPTLAYAATPAPLTFELGTGRDPAAAIAALERAARASGSADDPGDTVTVRMESWSLSTRIHRGETVKSAIIPELSEWRRNADGSGTDRVVAGEPQFPNEEFRRAWHAHGRPAKSGTVVRNETYGPGQMVTMYPDRLPTDPAALFVELGRGHPDLETDTAEFFTAIGDLYREQQPSSALRAALFELLAERTDVVLLGTVRDRRGRAVVALAVDSDRSGLPTRYIQMYDPSNGRLLASEEILTERAGMLRVPIPSVIQYSNWD